MAGLEALRLRDFLPRIDERLRDDDGAPSAVRVPDLEFVPQVRPLDGHHRIPDILIDPGGVDGRGNMANGLSAELDGPLRHVESEGLAGDLDSDQLAPRALFLDPLEGGLPDERARLVQVDETTEIDLVRIVLDRHVSPVVQDARLDSPDVRWPSRSKVVFLPRLHHGIPEILSAGR